MRHPHCTDLALYAGGDLPLWRRLSIAWHLKRCPACSEEVDRYGEQRRLTAELSASLPDDLNWDALAAEMKANIQLGLAAGECVSERAAAPHRLGWRAAAAIACATVIIVSGWWLYFPRLHPPAAGQEEEGAVLAATSDGIELKDEDRALTLMHASSEPVMLSVSAGGGMEAHYIDDETGMVTINNVYVQ